MDRSELLRFGIERQNIDVWLTKSGDEFLDVESKEGSYHIFVKKG